jgi:hypothetical protein
MAKNAAGLMPINCGKCQLEEERPVAENLK